ncbi:PEGA domain-containing protein [Stigmatella sp. ncwal1]|uniref:PEGA domain-containing protein n=1 Tax=Stigmatella ashevillensis TaxID=2995309 RepID=A0ABT5DLI3_9BACT|nr:PEGA domain-containing protein [Stigmatella ashevillena]MDC0713222.1 PEGA domain-containing protein [Stigmatella ashevillena]
MLKSRPSTALALVFLLLAWASPVSAQQLSTGTERPWAKGVSQEKQKTALELFRAGNALLKESIFVQAAEKYRQALALWDHPAIHYNMALALLNLDQPVEVHEHLEAAVRYGAAPLDSEKFENARAYKTLVEKQLSRVIITCDSPGASVTLDGRVLFVAPGRYEGLVRPGQHTLLATQEGHPTTDMSRTLLPGETTTLTLKLYTTEELTRYRRHWSAWKPWALMGAGVAVALGGGALHMQSRSSYRDFDTQVSSCGGCVPPQTVTDLRIRGDNLQRVALGTYALGGAAVITGAVLVYINRSQPYRINPGSAANESQAVNLAPLFGGRERGIQATFRF